MTTKNNRKQGATKSKAQTPIERAAKRAGIKPAEPIETLTPEDESVIQDLDALGLRSTNCRALVSRMRTDGHSNDTIRQRLIHEAGMLEKVAERLSPEQSTRDAMLADALEIVDLAESIFYVNGIHGSDPESILHEALSSLEQDLGGFGARLEGCDSDIDWQELWRARDRAKLSRHLAEFRRTHGVYKPAEKKDEQTETAVSS